MTINELPSNIRVLALLRQAEAGNEEDSDINLYRGADQGNFDFDKTPEGDVFWSAIADQNYQVFRNWYGSENAGNSIERKDDIYVSGTYEFLLRFLGQIQGNIAVTQRDSQIWAEYEKGFHCMKFDKNGVLMTETPYSLAYQIPRDFTTAFGEVIKLLEEFNEEDTTASDTSSDSESDSDSSGDEAKLKDLENPDDNVLSHVRTNSGTAFIKTDYLIGDSIRKAVIGFSHGQNDIVTSQDLKVADSLMEQGFDVSYAGYTLSQNDIDKATKLLDRMNDEMGVED